MGRLADDTGDDRRLRGVVNDAFTDEWVQHPIGDTSGLRCLDDVPLQELSVGGNEPVVVVGRPDSAFQPPVRRVQRVGLMRSVEVESCRLSFCRISLSL